MVFAPIPRCNDRFARQNRCGLPPEISPGFTISGNSSPSFGSHPTRSFGRPSRNILTDIKSVLCHCSTPSGLSIHQTCEPDNLLGPCFKTGPMRLDFTLINHECYHSGWGSSGTNGGFLPRHVSLIGFPTNDFTRYLHALYKVLFKLPSRYFCAITSLLYLVFDGMYHHRFRLHSQTVLLLGARTESIGIV